MTTLSERLQSLRDARDWTFQQAADAAGISPAQWHALEAEINSNPTLLTLGRVATALDMTLTELLAPVSVDDEQAAAEPSTFRERMRARRKLLGLNQADAATEAGLSRSEWSDMERGHRTNPTWIRIQQVARALDLHPAELLFHVAPSDGGAEESDDD